MANGRVLHGGVLWSPAGLYREGFTLQAVLSGRELPLPIRCAQQCLGERRRRRNPIVAGLTLQARGGLDIKNDVTVPYDPSNRLHGTSAGVRAAYCWKLNNWFYLDPEAQTFACTGYNQLRLGAQMTG
ncbi:MAG TPA: hypothetical protein VFC45_13830 [Pseudolabrys sp.]|nr:hypothetical protein [Pseudolabrys sp.]